jgi:CheY-like chemotaxis protein
MTNGTLVRGLNSPHKTSPTTIVSESFNHKKCRWTHNKQGNRISFLELLYKLRHNNLAFKALLNKCTLQATLKKRCDCPGTRKRNEDAMIQVLVVDDLPMVRRGLCMQLTLESDIEVVGEADGGEEALLLVRQLQPDVVLMDLKMPGMDGLAATRVIQTISPRSAVVILSLYDDALLKREARAAGAVAFVGKHEGIDRMLAAIRKCVERVRNRS